MFVACHMKRRDESFHIFDIEGAFRADTILSEEVVQRCAKKLAVDEEFQRDGLVGVQKAIYQSRKLVTFEFCGMSVSRCVCKTSQRKA